jgi:hypothetical protein
MVCFTVVVARIDRLGCLLLHVRVIAPTCKSDCSYMKEQSLLHEGAIDSTCRSNQLNSISLATKLMK